jgi:hypothetical protein
MTLFLFVESDKIADKLVRKNRRLDYKRKFLELYVIKKSHRAGQDRSRQKYCRTGLDQLAKSLYRTDYRL